jgi:tetratricopeptide (TPR) repeat protein
MGRLAHKLDVEPFTPELGAQFLLRRATILAQNASLEQATAQDRTLALRITHELGGLPLALDQAGAYLEETGCSLSAYLQLYQRHRLKLLSERRGRVSDHPEPVAKTWELAFGRLQADQPAAADLLRLCTYLSPDAIPEELLTEGASCLGEQLAPIAADSLLLNAAIENLRAYSLIGRSRATQTLSIHRLVQAVLQDTMDKPTRTLWAERAVRVVDATFPSPEFAHWPQCERLLPQALACAQHIEHRQLTFSEATRLLNDTAIYLYDQSRYPEAELLYEQALTIREQQVGPEHPDTATSLNNLAALYYTQGKYEQAEPLYKRALAIWEQQLGPEHPKTATSLNNLAALYYTQGKYEQAEPLLRRALAIFEQRLGAKHPTTRTIQDNYDALLRAMGKRSG